MHEPERGRRENNVRMARACTDVPDTEDGSQVEGHLDTEMLPRTLHGSGGTQSERASRGA